MSVILSFKTTVNCILVDKNYVSGTLAQILTESLLLQKQTLPHMKALILSFLELEGQVRGIIMEVPCPLPVKSILSLKSRVWHPKDDTTPTFSIEIPNASPKGSCKWG